MERGFEEISLPRILTVEELQQLDHELLVDTPLGGTRRKVRRFQETQEKLVYQLREGW